MQDVADNRDFQTLDPAFVLTNREGVEQCLGRMLVGAITRIYYRRVSHLCEMLRRAGHRVPDDDAIGRHRFEVARGIEQGLAFRDAGCRDTDIHGVG